MISHQWECPDELKFQLLQTGIWAYGESFLRDMSEDEKQFVKEYGEAQRKEALNNAAWGPDALLKMKNEAHLNAYWGKDLP